RAGIFVKNGTTGALELADTGIRIDANDEDVAFTARAFEITDVADVKRIEAAVGKNDPLTALLMLRYFAAKPFALDDFGCS
ncbi:MAG: hypothetical protein WBE70_00805, partial [Candidatus Acidiferrum sp.]